MSGYPANEREARTAADRVEAVLASHCCPARVTWMMDIERQVMEFCVPERAPNVAVEIGRAVGALHCRIRYGVIVVGWGSAISNPRDVVTLRRT